MKLNKKKILHYPKTYVKRGWKALMIANVQHLLVKIKKYQHKHKKNIESIM